MVIDIRLKLNEYLRVLSMGFGVTDINDLWSFVKFKVENPYRLVGFFILLTLPPVKNHFKTKNPKT